jgi:hypothetical protein
MFYLTYLINFKKSSLSSPAELSVFEDIFLILDEWLPPAALVAVIKG